MQPWSNLGSNSDFTDETRGRSWTGEGRMSRTSRVAVLLMASLFFSAPVLAGQCLGPDAATTVQGEFTALFGGAGDIDSMSVLEDGLVMTVLFERGLYRFRGAAGLDGALAFSAVPPPRPPAVLLEQVALLAQRIPPTIWMSCGEQRPLESASGLQLLIAEDLSELPSGACRPAPGRVCADEYWTVPPRLSYSGAIATYALHIVLMLGLIVAGFAWFRRNPVMPDEECTLRREPRR